MTQKFPSRNQIINSVKNDANTVCVLKEDLTKRQTTKIKNCLYKNNIPYSKLKGTIKINMGLLTYQQKTKLAYCLASIAYCARKGCKNHIKKKGYDCCSKKCAIAYNKGKNSNNSNSNNNNNNNNYNNNYKKSKKIKKCARAGCNKKPNNGFQHCCKEHATGKCPVCKNSYNSSYPTCSLTCAKNFY